MAALDLETKTLEEVFVKGVRYCKILHHCQTIPIPTLSKYRASIPETDTSIFHF